MLFEMIPNCFCLCGPQQPVIKRTMSNKLIFTSTSHKAMLSIEPTMHAHLLKV